MYIRYLVITYVDHGWTIMEMLVLVILSNIVMGCCKFLTDTITKNHCIVYPLLKMDVKTI